METLMEVRDTEIISPSGGKPCFRTAHFLKPTIPTSQQFSNPPPFSQPTKPISQIAKSLSSKVNFHGWKKKPKNWTSWVQKLLPKFQSTWRKSSIYEAIMASTLEIPRSRDSVFSVAEKWCSETNTFVFSWGETTITLEDVLVLGGYSITGDSVLSTINSSEMLDVKLSLDTVYLQLRRSKARKVYQCQWMDVWMNHGSEFEHEAFLILWLSRYVLPAQAQKIINQNVFPIAILLARGTKIALAPAVLASIYNDLRLLRGMIVSLRELGDQDDGRVSNISLGSPLQLLQVWVWERFPTLSPKPNPLSDGLPRLQRWDKVKILNYDDLGLDFDSAIDSFLWRPYSMGLNKRSFCANLYVEKASWVCVGSEVSFDLESYARIVRNSSLVGLCCVEQYLPHRVSMQFGLDQDIPCAFPWVSDTRKAVWNDYNRPAGDVKMYIPSRLFESDVTTRYLDWWKKSNVKKENVEWVREIENAEPSVKPSQSSSKISLTVPPGFSPKGIRVRVAIGDDISPGSESDDHHLTLTESFKVKGVQKANGCSATVYREESPLFSAGNNASIQDISSANKCIENILHSEECTRKDLIIEDRIESKVGCKIRNPITIDKNEVQAVSNGTPKSSGMDILDRIARLQRIIDTVKAEKISQA